MLGVLGKGFTVIFKGSESIEVQPLSLIAFTVKSPEVLIFILRLVEPLLHKKVVAPVLEDCNVTLVSAQNVVALLALIVGLGGTGLEVIVKGVEKPVAQPKSLIVFTE
jgi:hypothetical protein